MRIAVCLAPMVVLWLAAAVSANVPPATPSVTEPSTDGKIVNPADVHMESSSFSDADPGDTHVCTDWEIWTITPSERVWITACIAGPERVHTHLGDGIFENSHAGRTQLLYNTNYKLRVRHKDGSGDPATQWSGWGERLFKTGTAATIFPMTIEDAADSPLPAWRDGVGSNIILPSGAPAPTLRLDNGGGGLFLLVSGHDGVANVVTNPPSLTIHGNVRLIISAGMIGQNLALPESSFQFTEDDGEELTVYLPAMSIPPGEQRFLWVSVNGSTYWGTAAQAQPDFTSLARGSPVPWAVRQSGYRVEVVATGFQLPVNIAFVPAPGPDPDAPLYYVAELYGQIKVVTRAGAVGDYATGLLNFNPTGNFPGSGEQGVGGIVVEPQTGDVLVGLLYEDTASQANPKPHYPKVIRMHSNNGGLTAASTQVILDMFGETQGQSHQISNLSLGLDGKLYVHMGDGFDTARAQDLSSFRGKILRLNLDGSAPQDNPFYNAADGITPKDYVYAYGFRNPFGGAWRAADGFHYEVENGPSHDRFARVVAGRNYLWNGTDASMHNFALYNWVPATAPVNIAFIQPSTFGGSGFPQEKMDHAFVSESGPTYATGPVSNGKRITEFVLDANGERISGPVPLVEYTGSGKATAVALAAGPDGLYFSDLYKDLNYSSAIDRGANVLRIKYVGIAEFTADVTSGAAPLTVHFQDASRIPGTPSWQWEFGDGTTSDQQNPTHVYGRNGVYTVRLRVTGANGITIAQKNGYIRVGVLPSIALIGGSLPLSMSDAAIADHLRLSGFDVSEYDDEPANRPTAADLGAGHDLVVVSSTVSSVNIDNQFRDVAVPLLYWEQALNREAREPLAASGVAMANTTAINVLDNTHPITAGIALGQVQVFNPAASMSVASGTIAAQATVLATRWGAADQPAILAAEAGSTLLGGHVTPARRVFLFLEDSSWLSAAPVAKRIFDQAVNWAMNRIVVKIRSDFDGDDDVDQEDFGHLQACFSGGGVNQETPECADARLDDDGDVDEDDFAVFSGCMSGAGVPADPSCQP